MGEALQVVSIDTMVWVVSLLLGPFPLPGTVTSSLADFLDPVPLPLRLSQDWTVRLSLGGRVCSLIPSDLPASGHGILLVSKHPWDVCGAVERA